MMESFTARRSAAAGLPTLPAFQLPPVDFAAMSKYPSFASMGTSQSTPAIINTALTPPGLAGLNSDNILSPIPSVNSGSSTGSSGNSATYQSMGFWPTPQSSSSFTYSSAPALHAPFAPQHNPMSRPLYSPPSMPFPPTRTPTSPQNNDGLPPPPYDLNLPPFPTSLSLSGSSGAQQSLPNLVQQQSQAQQSQQHAQSQAASQGPSHASENYGARPRPTSTYYTPTSTPQQSTFPAFSQPPPAQSSLPTTSAPQHRMSPISAPVHNAIDVAQNAYSRPYTYNLPAMAAPIMSNMHNPGSQMSLLGSLNMPYATHHLGPPMFHHQTMHQQQMSDRPFKCDQCQQSFNRNHDLKRHKRIHLAVKPFPCGHCEKSFSRKDALKRHILVKGCGKSAEVASDQRVESQSPNENSEAMTDEGSPLSAKREA